MDDWRAHLLAGLDLGPAGEVGVRWTRATLGTHDVVLVVWDFAVAGGSFGRAEADAFVAACDAAVAERLPLVTLVRSGGTRLTEGMRALRGMARAVLATQRLVDAGVCHLSVADDPTCGGVWVTVVQRATLRAAVSGATVGFAGPRVVAAVTGDPVRDSHTAETASSNGLVDALVLPDDVLPWLVDSLEALRARVQPRGELPPAPPAHPTTGWDRVVAVREPGRPGAEQLLRTVLGDDGVPLAAGRKALTAFAYISGGVVGVALGSWPGSRPGPDAYELVRCAADKAGQLGLPLVTVVDTPGAEPGSAAENDGIAIAISQTFAAVLSCGSPTVGVLVGEGGSGGALAALVCDRVLATPLSYAAALVPEGAAVTLRRPVAEAASLMVVDDLVVVDALVDPGATFGDAVRAHLGEVCALPWDERLALRSARWG